MRLREWRRPARRRSARADPRARGRRCAPTAMRGRGRPNARAGPAVMRSTIGSSGDDARLDESGARAPGRPSPGRSRRWAPPGTAPPSRPDGAARGRSRCSRSCRRAARRRAPAGRDSAASGGFILSVGVERRTASSREQQVVRRGLGRDVDARGARAPHLLERLVDVQVAEVERAALVAGDAQVAGDHRRLGDGRIAAMPSSADTAPSCMSARARERRVLAVQREHAARASPRTAARGAGARRESTGRPSSVKPAAPRSASVAEPARAAAPSGPREIAARKPTRTRASSAAALEQRLEHRRRVDHRVGVRHREHGAVAAGGGRCGAGREILLVLLARACAGARADR